MKKIISVLVVMPLVICAAQEPVEDTSWLKYINDDKGTSEAIQISPQESPQETVFLAEDSLQDYVAEAPRNLPFGEDSQIFRCSAVGCSTRFKEKKRLKYHLKTVHGIDQLDTSIADLKPYICSIDNCCQKYATPSGLENHKARAHGYGEVKIPTVKKNLSCLLCKEVFTSMKNLNNHRKKFHTYLCGIDGCDRSFLRKDRLKSHQDDHLTKKTRIITKNYSQPGKKRFSCPILDCGKAFVRKYKLELHKAIHITQGSTQQTQDQIDGTSDHAQTQTLGLGALACMDHELEDQSLNLADDVAPESPQVTTDHTLYDIFCGMNHKSTTLNEGNL